ncbi:unnamed protein product, partial [Iphiclides podalirius]
MELNRQRTESSQSRRAARPSAARGRGRAEARGSSETGATQSHLVPDTAGASPAPPRPRPAPAPDEALTGGGRCVAGPRVAQQARQVGAARGLRAQRAPQQRSCRAAHAPPRRQRRAARTARALRRRRRRAPPRREARLAVAGALPRQLCKRRPTVTATTASAANTRRDLTEKRRNRKSEARDATRNFGTVTLGVAYAYS